MSLVPGGRGGLSALEAADLLLVLILCLGGARLLGLFFAPALSVDITAGEDPAPPDVVLVLFLLILQNLLILWAVYWVAVQGRGIAWSALGVVMPKGLWMKRSILTAIIAFPVIGLVNWLVSSLAGEPLENPQLELVGLGGFSWTGLIGMLLVLGVLVPPTEELLFRGLIYGWLRERWDPWIAGVAGALCFALLHGVVWLVPAVFALGLILTWLYEESGSLLASATTHGLYNSISTILLYAALAAGTVPPQ